MEGSSRSHMFFKIVVLKIFANFTGKHLNWSLFLTKFFTNFIKITPTQVFSCAMCKIFKNTFFYRAPPVAASVKRDSNTGVLSVEFAKFLRTLFFLLISCLFYRYFQFRYSFPRNGTGEKALSFWFSLQYNSFFQNNAFAY